MVTTTKMEPKEIDKILAELWYEAAVLRGRIDQMEESTATYLKKIEENPNSRFTYRDALAHYEKELPLKKSALAENEATAAPYEAEYRSRPWNRYFLVKQANGHVHRGTSCTTCYFDTAYGWLTDLSDCDENQMVEQYGEKACTICFPNAPVHPEFMRSLAEREAAEKAKAESTCKGEGNWYNPNKRYSDCLACGKHFCTITPNGALRAHKRPE